MSTSNKPIFQDGFWAVQTKEGLLILLDGGLTRALTEVSPVAELAFNDGILKVALIGGSVARMFAPHIDGDIKYGPQLTEANGLYYMRRDGEVLMPGVKIN